MRPLDYVSVASLDVLTPPVMPVEAAIAATVLMAGVASLLPGVAMHGARIAFGFGLIHGFGFANALKDLGISHGAMFMPLAGFNIGVEFGQLAIVSLALPLFALCRKWRGYRNVFVPTSSLIVSAIAAWWLLQRTGSA